MINLLYRLFLAFNSSSLILIVYAIKSDITLNSIFPKLIVIPSYVSYLIYIVLSLLLTGFSLYLSRSLDVDELEVNSIENVESANDSFLPSYLGYFFVALDVPDLETLYFVYAIIYVFTFVSQTLYFNPVFMIFGYHFYNLTTNNNVRIFMITKKKFKSPRNLGFTKIRRINDFTFID